MRKMTIGREAISLLDREKTEVHIDDIEVFENEYGKGIVIKWYGSPGFGEYTIYKSYKSPDSSGWKCDSEYMDSLDDHWFLNRLFDDFVNNHVEEMM